MKCRRPVNMILSNLIEFIDLFHTRYDPKYQTGKNRNKDTNNALHKKINSSSYFRIGISYFVKHGYWH